MIKIEVEKVGEELDISAEQQGNSLDNLIELAAWCSPRFRRLAERSRRGDALC